MFNNLTILLNTTKYEDASKKAHERKQQTKNEKLQ